MHAMIAIQAQWLPVNDVLISPSLKAMRTTKRKEIVLVTAMTVWGTKLLPDIATASEHANKVQSVNAVLWVTCGRCC